jgi:hypothetical protein
MSVPMVIPVNTPEDDPMVPMAILETLHVPPVVASDSVVVPPGHTIVEPVMAATCPNEANENSSATTVR